MTPLDVEHAQQSRRKEYALRTLTSTRMRDNMNRLIADPYVARECADEVMFIFDAANRFISSTSEKRLELLLQYIASTQDLKRALFAIFKAGLNGVCKDTTLAEEIANETHENSIGESDKQHKIREIQVFVDAIREAYAVSFHQKYGVPLEKFLEKVTMDSKEDSLVASFKKNCAHLQQVLQTFGWNGITLNGACVDADVAESDDDDESDDDESNDDNDDSDDDDEDLEEREFKLATRQELKLLSKR